LSLAPKWAHKAAVVGLRLQFQALLLQFGDRITTEQRRLYQEWIDEVASMKD